MNLAWQNAAMVTKATPKWFLRDWRKHKGLTQDQLAERTGLTKGFISQLEVGVRQYNQQLLELFAIEFGCKPADLITRRPTDLERIFDAADGANEREEAQIVQMIKVIRGSGSQGTGTGG